jgi:hypothetical protein
MRALPKSDRRSWTFQAAMHGTIDPMAMDPLFNQCQHGTLQFFTWHRAYLHFFERILRWAANDPTLNLPYWDWTLQPILPEPFRSPADSSANSLYEPKRKANDGSALLTQVVVTDLENALANTAFPASGDTGFSPDLEGSPHGAIHTLVGGQGGLMSSVPTAANDPIFWLHHCNIDRLWNVWLNRGGGRVNPSEAAYLDQAYSFADETGATVTVKVRDIIRSATLGYRYDSVPNPAEPFAVSERKAVGATPPQVVATSAPGGRTEPLEKVEAKPLGFKEERVKLNTAKEKRPLMMRALPDDGASDDAPKVMIAVEGLSADLAPDFVYGVYVNLPEGQPSDEVLQRHYVGSINFFGKTKADAKAGHDHGEGNSFNATFNATKVLAGLQRAKKLDPDAITVTILPIVTKPPGVGAAEIKSRGEAASKKAKVSYRRISVHVTERGE